MWHITYERRQTNHILHAILTFFFTCGMWAPVWIAIATYNAYAKLQARSATWIPEQEPANV